MMGWKWEDCEKSRSTLVEPVTKGKAIKRDNLKLCTWYHYSFGRKNPLEQKCWTKVDIRARMVLRFPS